MKAGKKILKWAIIFCLSFVTFNLFISSDYEFERSIEINAPSDIVFNQVTDLHNWPNWAVWWKNDSTIVTEFNEVKSGKGASMEWNGLDGTKVSIEILSVNLEGMTASIKFKNRTQYGFWKFEEIDGKTKVTWVLQEKMLFFARFTTLFIEKMESRYLEEGLEGLKEVCEYKNLVE
ncbi:MAG: SRPBCC family protein [Flavobacteriales bacterium]